MLLAPGRSALSLCGQPRSRARSSIARQSRSSVDTWARALVSCFCACCILAARPATAADLGRGVGVNRRRWACDASHLPSPLDAAAPLVMTAPVISGSSAQVQYRLSNCSCGILICSRPQRGEGAPLGVVSNMVGCR